VKRWSFLVANCTHRSVINAASKDPLEALKQITSGDLPTVAFDATGNPQSMMSAFEYPARGGRLTFVGLFPGDVTFNDHPVHYPSRLPTRSRNFFVGLSLRLA
jgi:threonine dehydrogenase-like Zn-dependent dehydrogenase